jgi:uncharacterized repeat protein (TIGR01451 family)
MRTRSINLFLRPALIAVLGLTLTFDVATGASGVADLSLSVSIPQSHDAHLSYFITVSNAGPAVATGVVISNQISTNTIYVSVTGGATPTNGVLLVPLGSLAVGATNSILIVEWVTNTPSETLVVIVENFSQVSADQTDPNPANNSLDVQTGCDPFNTSLSTTSTLTYETNFTATVNQRVNNYATELIAKLPDGTVVYDQTYNADYSDPIVQAAVAQAAAALTQAGAISYAGPIPSSLGSSIWVGTSSVTVTNVIGTDTSFATTLYVGPQWIMVGANQSQSFFIQAGGMVFDTLVTSVVTNLVTTTNTDTYLNSAVYMMTGIVAKADLSLSIAHVGNSAVVFWPNIGSYTLQQNSNLATGSWTTSGYSISTANGTNSITISPPVGSLFFRLRQ